MTDVDNKNQHYPDDGISTEIDRYNSTVRSVLPMILAALAVASILLTLYFTGESLKQKGILSIQYLKYISSLDFFTCLSHAYRLMLIASLVLVSSALGKRLLLFFSLSGKTSILIASQSTALGLGIISFILTMLAWAGGLSLVKLPYLPLILIGSAGLVFFYYIHSLISDKKPIPDGEQCKWFRWSDVAWLFAASGAIAIHLLLALTPPIEVDELFYHLFEAKSYLHAGSFIEIPSVFATYWPCASEMLFSLAMGMSDDIAAKLVHSAFWLICGIALYAIVRKEINQKHLSIALTIAFITMPLVNKSGAAAYVDLSFSLYALLAFYSAFRFFENQMWGDFHFACLLAGFSLSTKWFGVNICFIVVSLCIWGWFKSGHVKPFKAFKHFFIGGLWCSLPISPLLLRNWLWTKNPFYPFADSLFHSHAWVQGALASYKLINLSKIHGIIDLLFPGYGLSLLLFGSFAILAAWKNRKARIEVLVALVYSAMVSLESPQSRFFFPAVALLTIAAARSLKNLANRYWRLTFVVIFSLAIVMNIYISFVFHAYRVPVMCNQTYRDQYLAQALPNYELIQWINTNAGPNDKYFTIYVPELYYFDVSFINGYLYTDRVLDYLTIISAEDFVGRLKKLGVTHLVVNNFYKEALEYDSRVKKAYALPEDIKTFDWHVYHTIEMYLNSPYWRLVKHFPGQKPAMILQIMYPHHS